jgi:hypothetical protein
MLLLEDALSDVVISFRSLRTDNSDTHAQILEETRLNRVPFKNQPRDSAGNALTEGNPRAIKRYRIIPVMEARNKPRINPKYKFTPENAESYDCS